MAKAKIILFESKILKDETHPLLLRLTIGSVRKYFTIGYSLNKNQWDKTKMVPKGTSPEIKRLKLIVQDIESKANQFIYDNTKEGQVLNVAKFEEAIFGKQTYGFMLHYFGETIEKLTKAGKNGNANAYKNTYGVFRQFRKDKDIAFQQFTLSELKKFEQFLLERNLSANGISFHMRTLRALYNRAIDEEIATKDTYPFEKYSIKREKTMHRALTLEEIVKLIAFDVSKSQPMQLAKDFFLFSFYMRGISFVDMAHLQVKNLHNNRLNYKRAKTGDIFNIEIPEAALQIVQTYNNLTEPDSFLFPIIKSEIEQYKQYRCRYRIIMRNLAKIGEMIETNIPLTTYVARHSWATIAKRAGISTSIISESMGHETEEVTQVYLDSFENSVLDEANKKIIELL